MNLERAIELIGGWAFSTEQEYCVGAEESRALYQELDEVKAFIRGLAASTDKASVGGPLALTGGELAGSQAGERNEAER